MLTVENYKNMRKQFGKVVDDSWLPVTVTSSASSSVKFRPPEMDLTPEKVFMNWYGGKKLSAFKVPVVTISRVDGSTLSGVITYAKNFNPPRGCFRVPRP